MNGKVDREVNGEVDGTREGKSIYIHNPQPLNGADAAVHETTFPAPARSHSHLPPRAVRAAQLQRAKRERR